MIITLDGCIATGKSTVAKNLAHQLGFIYFDTGAMYRALTYALLKHQVNVEDKNELANFLKDFKFDFKIWRGERTYYVENEDVTLKIRGPEVTAHVSRISAIPMVRERLISMQRELAVGVNAVFEGRDMGTVVFPNAELKIFLTGDPKIRAARRLAELRTKFPAETANLTIDQVIDDINERDRSDTQRALSPLKQASDALLLDTTNLSVEEVVLKILEFKDTRKTRLPNHA